MALERLLAVSEENVANKKKPNKISGFSPGGYYGGLQPAYGINNPYAGYNPYGAFNFNLMRVFLYDLACF